MRSRVIAVCGTCAWRESCRDVAALEQFRRFLDESRAASEFALLAGNKYRLGCERYRHQKKASQEAGVTTSPKVAERKRPPLHLVVVNDDRPTSA